METKTIIICRGLPGSGKSTWAKKFVHDNGSDKWIRINRDDLRDMTGDYWVPSRESLLDSFCRIMLCTAMTKGLNIVIDNMNLSSNTCKEIEDSVQDFNENYTYEWQYVFEYKDFFIPLEEVIIRDSLRSRSVGAKVIKNLYYKYRNLFIKESPNRPVLKQNMDLPHAIIVDIDGTLALNTSGRPFFGKGCEEGYLKDICVESVANIARSYPHNVIIVSGRENTELGKYNTVSWLSAHFIYYTHLYMRSEKDYRPDEVIKQEIFYKYIKDKYYVDYIIDDRDKVVKMWRNLGLLCLQPWDNKF